MHAEAYAFVQKATADLPVKGKRVLEIGSLNINGSVRPLFAEAKEYVGIDQIPGGNVDVVMGAADYDGKGRFDVVVTCEAMEHATRPADITECAWRALKPGGTLIITAAGAGRTPHSFNGGPLPAHEPYDNITRSALKSLLADWTDVEITEASGPHDIYATATKPTTTEDTDGESRNTTRAKQPDLPRRHDRPTDRKTVEPDRDGGE